MNKYFRILIFVATCLGIGYCSGIATQSGGNDWFPTLKKPVFNPPKEVFMPVWTTLYVFMGVAAGLVWAEIESRREEVASALRFFWIQLALNAAWSFLFFMLKNPLLAFIEMIVLWLMIYETWYKFRRINAVSGWLFVPYLLWVSFALVLNGSLWWLNR
ncbi:sensory protein TspO [Flavobacterium magnum]|uniref:Sensory protein TspO n=1 Tax=Flavobacterium magnum TaxID=2162713 RepID=A0A2S0RE86_9FLAO|nr:TspO/MBR family protein [Flavobacterium magnum]AWA29558.1 sensory protein TspO [Flavobacterium magnum]